MKYLICLFIFLAMVLGLSSQVLFFNEIVYDTPGNDTNTFIELKGSPGMILDSFYVIGINGNGGAVYATIPLLPFTIPADSYFVIGQAGTVPNVDFINALADLQNGDDNIILVKDSSGVIDTFDAVGYGLFDTEVFVGEGMPTYDVSAISLARYESFDYNNNYWDYTGFKRRTPGYANPIKIEESIFNIQNSPDTSLFVDSTIYFYGIVTAVFPSADLYFVQDGSGAYNGIAINGDKRVDSISVNDTICIYSGFVFESAERTTIKYPISGENSSTVTIAVSTDLSLDSIGEPYEGQLITVYNVIITDTLGFGECEIKDLDSNFSRIDDYGTYTTPVIGDKFASITGILEYTYSNYKIEPRDQNDLIYGYLASGTIGLSDNPADSSGTEVFVVEAGVMDSTDSSGYYEFDFVPAGSYTLIVSHTGYKTDTINAVFTGTETFDVTLNIIATYSVSGIVGLSDAPIDSSGSIVEISELVLLDTTDASGYYEFTDINNGIYTFIFTHTGYVPDTIIDTIQDSNINIDVMLIDLSGIEKEDIEKLPIISSFSSKNGIISFMFNKQSNGTAKINIFDITGRNIVNRNITGEPGIYEMSIDHRLSKGIYFLNINYFDGDITKKFVIID